MNPKAEIIKILTEDHDYEVTAIGFQRSNDLWSGQVVRGAFVEYRKDLNSTTRIYRPSYKALVEEIDARMEALHS